MGTFDIVLYLNKIHHKDFTYKILDEVIVMVPIVIYFKKNSFLVEAMNEKLSVFKSAGLINYWTGNSLQSKYLKAEETNVGPRKLTVKTISGALQLTILGWIASLIAFMLEFIKFKIRTRKRIRRFWKILSFFYRKKHLMPFLVTLLIRKLREALNY